MISQEKINDIVLKIAEHYDPERIYLFGSYATGTHTKDSDLDFIIIKNTDQPKHKRGRIVRKILIGSMVPMDLKIYTPKEFKAELSRQATFLNGIIKESKLLYERENSGIKKVD